MQEFGHRRRAEALDRVGVREVVDRLPGAEAGEQVGEVVGPLDGARWSDSVMVRKRDSPSCDATWRPITGVQSVSYSPVTTTLGSAGIGSGRYHSWRIRRVLCSADMRICSAFWPAICW